MATNYKTEQEAFWAGRFGNEYISRNQSEGLRAANLAFFSRILQSTNNIHSIIEFGANMGINVQTLQALIPKVQASAVEINEAAVAELRNLPSVSVYHQSILEFTPTETYDFVFTKGVLIHMNPEHLPYIYELIFKSSKRYICIAEYYNPSPVEVPYRGHTGKLFKRDFAGEILDQFHNLELVDYGFAYHRDPNFSQDDISWFLIRKNDT